MVGFRPSNPNGLARTNSSWRSSTFLWICVLGSMVYAPVVVALASTKVYRYFGYGSNVIPSTMKALRQIDVKDATAAVLPDYELTFSSAAFARPVDSRNDGRKSAENQLRDHSIHGILYTLTEEDFARVGSSEGVPFLYRWKRVLVYPYRGDGLDAGKTAWKDPDAKPLEAYTLVELQSSSPRQSERVGDLGIPPSESYLGLIRQGAQLWKFDKSYQDRLATIPIAKSRNFLLPQGWEGPALEMAERATGTKRTYMIDGYF